MTAAAAPGESPEVGAELPVSMFPPGPVQSSTEEALRAAGRFDSYLGQTAMALAGWLDSPGCTSPSAVAKELRSVMVEATKSMAQKSSPDQMQDELEERRRKRGA